MAILIHRRQAGTALLTALFAMLLAGCSSAPAVAGGHDGCRPKSGQAGIQLELIQQLVADGQYYSALAHLEQQQLNSPSAQLLRAESLRKTGHLDQADAIYQQLSHSCYSALGHLGMGKIAAVRGDLKRARLQLGLAREKSPTDANIRNDFGFVLLVGGDYKGAQQEFMTAIQLNNAHNIAIKNLLLSLLLSGEQEMAWRLAQHNGIDLQAFRALVKRSVQFRQTRLADAVNAPESTIHQPILDRQGAPL